MNKNIYSKTRYQNIYKNKKHGNYIVAISNPKTTISKFDDKKIFDIEIALKIRNNNLIKPKKSSDTGTFREIWYKYMIECEKVEKQAYNTRKKKSILYNKYFNYFENKKIKKISKSEIVNYIDKLDTSNKQKNEILKRLKAFFNWCCANDYLDSSPTQYIKPYKVSKPEITYWLPEEFKKFLEVVNYDIFNSTNIDTIISAYRIRILTLLDFSLGDRLGETRALTFGCINESHKTIDIKHSINYDPNSESFFSETKNKHSEDTLEISEKLISEINNWKNFLINKCKLKITDNTPIILNLKTNKPISDTALRKTFYKYIDLAGIPKIKMYNLRHTFATTMMNYEDVVIYEVSDRLRHRKITTTVNTYGNITKKNKRKLADATDKYY